MRVAVAVAAVLAVLMLGPGMAQASPSKGARGAPTAAPSIDILPWKASTTVCLGPKNTRRAIKWLNRGKWAYALASAGLNRVRFPGLLFKMLAVGGKVNQLVARSYARDTARAYLHSNRRGAKVRVGIRGTGPINIPGWDAKKRGVNCD